MHSTLSSFISLHSIAVLCSAGSIPHVHCMCQCAAVGVSCREGREVSLLVMKAFPGTQDGLLLS